MKFVSLPKMFRYLSIAFLMSGFVTIASLAHASMICTWVDEFPVVSDPSTQERLEAHVKRFLASRITRSEILMAVFHRLSGRWILQRDPPLR
jgi:hypothetical protein